jgi:predicted DNA-binding transcriptional regulator YafY
MLCHDFPAMRADRLLSILLLLQTRGRVTARELSEELEVSERTVLRDMDALNAAGIPVVAQRGASGGWSLIEGYRTELTGLREEEIRAVFVGTPHKLLADLKLDRASNAALLKLLTALPSIYRQGAEYARQRIYIDLAGWKTSREQVPLLPALQDAVFREHRIAIDYTHGERVVDPLGLVAKGNLWYLVAAHDGQPRTYRVSRITRVTPLDAPVERPGDFDLSTFWHESMQSFRERLPRFDCVAIVEREQLRGIETYLRYGSIDGVEEHDEKRVRVTMHFDAMEAAALSLMHPGVTIVEPPELREEVVRIARAVMESRS